MTLCTPTKTFGQFVTALRAVVVAVSLSLMAAAVPHAQEPPPTVAPVMYCFLISVIGVDNYKDVRAMALALASKVSGRDPASDDPTDFGRYVLADTEPEIPMRMIVAISHDATAASRVELQRLPLTWVQTFDYAAVLTRHQAEIHLRDEALSGGCDKGWLVRPGVNLDGFTPGQFVQMNQLVVD